MRQDKLAATQREGASLYLGTNGRTHVVLSCIPHPLPALQLIGENMFIGLACNVSRCLRTSKLRLAALLYPSPELDVMVLGLDRSNDSRNVRRAMEFLEVFGG